MCYAHREPRRSKDTPHFTYGLCITRQNRSESSGVHGDNKRRFLFASYGQLPYHPVSLRVMFDFFRLLMQMLGLGVDGRDRINGIFILNFFKQGKIALTYSTLNAAALYII